MVSKNRGTYGFLGTSWVLITMAPRNTAVHVATNAPQRCQIRMYRTAVPIVVQQQYVCSNWSGFARCMYN